MSFRKSSTRLNLIASSAFAVIVLIVVCGGFLRVLGLQRIAMQDIQARDLGRTEMVTTLLRQVSENQRALSETLIAAADHKLDEEGVYHRGRDAIDFVRAAEDRFAKLQPLFADGDDLVEIFGVTLREFKTYRATIIDVVEISTVDVSLAATQMLKTTASFVRLVEDISQAADLSSDQTLADMDHLRAREQGNITYMLAGSAIAVAALLLAAFIFYLRMQRAEAERQESEQLQKKLEAQLQHSQRLEALGTLAGGIAHDLNNTLVPILGLSKLLRREIAEGSPAHADLETIIQAGAQARDLVRQILAFSRKQEIVKQRIDITAVARDALPMLRAIIPRTITLIEELQPVPPLLGDSGQIHQVLTNLVTNAARAIGDTLGKIHVRIFSAAADQDWSSETICLAVKDTGCGMDEATALRIFEPFFTTRAVGEGTGLGLSVVHGIVKDHGGTIKVRSTPGKGSEFIVRLPRCEADTQEAIRVPALAS